MPKRLTIAYRKDVLDFLNRFVEACDQCEDTSEMKKAAIHLLMHMELYNEKH